MFLSYRQFADANRRSMRFRRELKSGWKNNQIIVTIYEDIPMEDFPSRDTVFRRRVVSDDVPYRGLWWKNAW